MFQVLSHLLLLCLLVSSEQGGNRVFWCLSSQLLLFAGLTLTAMDAGERMSPVSGREVGFFQAENNQFSPHNKSTKFFGLFWILMYKNLLHEHSTLVTQFIHLCVSAFIQHENFGNTALLSQKLANRVVELAQRHF